jgi:hypothetical protein
VPVPTLKITAHAQLYGSLAARLHIAGVLGPLTSEQRENIKAALISKLQS